MSKLHTLIPVFSLSLLALPAFGNERSFTYTTESNVAPPGHAEIEPWVTLRTGREDYFHRYDARLEFEGGVVKNLQTALYLNFTSIAEDTPDVLTGEKYRSQFSRFSGVSSEWKLKLSDAVADPMGSALYLEGTFGAQLTELEFKLIADKSVRQWLFAANLVGEYEWEHASVEATYTYALVEANLAAAYTLSPAVALGLEVNAPFRFYGTPPPEREDSGVINVGPALSVRLSGFWIATTFLAQIVAPVGASSGALDLENNERFQARTIWGFHL